MTDANGNVAYGGQFDPYGQTLAEWSATGNTTLNTKKFTGYERDSATGLDYANARMYNNARGRFTSPDPIRLKAADLKKPESLNLYGYVRNDPLNFVDPNGNLLAFWVCNFVRTFFRNDAWWDLYECHVETYGGAGGGAYGGGGSSEEQDNPVQNATQLIKDAIDLAEKLLKNEGCRSAVENAAYAAFLASLPAGTPQPTPEEARFIRENVTSATAIVNKLREATKVSLETTYHPRFNAEANFGTQTITFYRGFFQNQVRNDVRRNNDPQFYYIDRSNREMAQTAIHEGMHLLFAGATDANLGVAFSGRPINGNDEQRRDEGSRRITAAIQQHCQNAGQ